MKPSKYTFTFFLLVLTCLALEANECSLRDLQVEPSTCEEGFFDLTLTFNHEEPDTHAFVLKGNGISYGIYQYEDLPITLDSLVADGTTYYEFEVRDTLRPECHTSVGLGKMDCFVCPLGQLLVETLPCDQGLFGLELTLGESDLLSGDDTLQLWIDWKWERSFTKNDLPLTIDSLEGTAWTSHHLKVKWPERPDCYVVKELDPLDCQPYLANLDVTPKDCAADSTYSASIQFHYNNIDTFRLIVNDSLLGVFHTADLPIEVSGILPSEHSTDHFTVCTTHDGEVCCLDRKIIPACSPVYCHMFEPLIQYSECEEGSYYLDIDFDSEGMRSDSFGVDFDWTPYQRFSYADLPIRIGPFTSDDWTDHYLLFYDLANHDCCTQMTIEGQTCPAILEITDAVVGECREDGSFPVSLSYEGYGFLKVDVYQGYEYLCTYDVHENPLVLDSLYATDPKVEIKLCPSGVEAECDVWTVEVPEACVGIPCGFDALTYEVSDCDSGFFYLHLIVDPAENSGEHFVVEGPFDYREELAFSDSVHVLGPFPSGEKFYEFHVGDPLNGDCYAPLTVGRVICPDQCDIVLGSVSALCVESGKVILLIDSISSLHSGYDLYINGEALGFFKASSFPLEKTIEVHEMDSIHVNICVSDNLTCCATTMVALEPCVSTCPIKELVLDTTECNNGMFSIIVDAELEEVDDTGRFQLAVMDSLWGVYNYAELPLTIGPFAADGKTKYRVVLEDLGVESCKVDGRLDAIVCTGPSAPAGDQIVVLRCQGLEQYVRIPAMLEEPTVMHLFNSNGLVIDQRNIASSTKYVVLNLDRPPSGLYVLRLRSAQGLVSRKVIIP